MCKMIVDDKSAYHDANGSSASTTLPSDIVASTRRLCPLDDLVASMSSPLMAAAISTNRVVDGNSTHVKDGLTHSFVKHGHCAVKIWPDRGVDKVRVSCWYARARKKPFAKDIQRIWSNNEMTSNSNGWVVSEGAAADSIV